MREALKLVTEELEKSCYSNYFTDIDDRDKISDDVRDASIAIASMCSSGFFVVDKALTIKALVEGAALYISEIDRLQSQEAGE